MSDRSWCGSCTAAPGEPGWQYNCHPNKSCLGTCGLAPVVMIDNEVHGDVTPDQVPAMLEKYLKKAKEQSGQSAVGSEQ